MSITENTLSNVCGPWCAIPLKLTTPNPTPSKYRWVLNKQNHPDLIQVVAIDKFQKSSKAQASLKDVFAFMNEKLKTVKFSYTFTHFFESPTSSPADYDLLKKLDSEITEKYKAYLKSRCIFARIMDLFLGFLGCECSVTTQYNRLHKKLDDYMSDVGGHVGGVKVRIDNCLTKNMAHWKNHGTISALPYPSHTFVAVVLKTKEKEHCFARFDVKFKEKLTAEALLKDIHTTAQTYLNSNTVTIDKNSELHFEVVSVAKKQDGKLSINKEHVWTSTNSLDHKIESESDEFDNFSPSNFAEAQTQVKPVYVQLPEEFIDKEETDKKEAAEAEKPK
jgi:hypothetical protein